MKLDFAQFKQLFTLVGMIVIALAAIKMIPGVDLSVGASPMTMAAVGAASIWAGK